MATFTSYDAVGLKEDVSDIITNISPTKTPFQSMIGREKVTQRWFQWQEDSLRAVSTTNSQVEGFDVTTFIQVNPTVMRANTTQILAEPVQVSGTMDATSTYGRARESAYQLSKSSQQLKRDLENYLVGFYQPQVSGTDSNAASTPQNVAQGISPGTATARLMGNFPTMVTLANNVVPIAVGTGASTGKSQLTEAALVQALQNCYTNGADPSQIMVTPMDSVAVAAFASAAGRYRTIATGGDDKKIVNAVNLYVSPFGEQKVVLNRFLHNKLPLTGSYAAGTSAVSSASTWTLVFDPSLWALATLRSWFREVLAKTGDSSKQMIVGEFSLKHKNFLATSAVVQNPDTTWAGAGW